VKIGLIHNEYAAFSGEEAMFYSIAALLQSRGHEVFTFTKTSQNIGNSVFSRAGAFFSGLYSLRSCREIRSFIQQFRPDVIQIQNLYPLISPAILPIIREYNIPIVMRCANYRLICPNGLLLRKGQLCKRCTCGKEWWCLLTNCERNIAKSAGYALRNFVARTKQWYHRYVNVFYVQTHFQKRMLIENGFPDAQIEVIPNMVSSGSVAYTPGSYIGYLGRISEEKGIGTFLKAAEQLKHIPFKVAGAVGMKGFSPESLPKNVDYLGFLDKEQKRSFIRDSAAIVVPSVCYEGLPGSILEAMSIGKPVVCSAIGGLPEIVSHESTGLLFTPGDVQDLIAKISRIWECPSLQESLGRGAYLWVQENLTENHYYERLMGVYRKVLNQ